MEMTRHAPVAPRLAALLSRHQDDIATAWAEKARDLPGTRYAEHSLADTHSCLSGRLAAVIETLSSGSYDPTVTHLEAMSRSRSQMEFDISEITEVLLLFCLLYTSDAADE